MEAATEPRATTPGGTPTRGLPPRPERFLSGDAPGTYEWIPFGGGVRRCLGASFALFEMKVVLKTVLQKIKLYETPNRRPEGVTRRAITFAPSRGARISLAG